MGRSCQLARTIGDRTARLYLDSRVIITITYAPSPIHLSLCQRLASTTNTYVFHAHCNRPRRSLQPLHSKLSQPCRYIQWVALTSSNAVYRIALDNPEFDRGFLLAALVNHPPTVVHNVTSKGNL